MPSYRTATVTSVDVERDGYQQVTVDGDERAYVLTKLTGPVAAGDRVVVNTTAVDLGLGTGGAHVVHWNLNRDAWSAPGPGHIMKLRYTSVQADTGAAEEGLAERMPATLDGMPVVATGLHSQMAVAAVAFHEVAPQARLAYVMTDGGALPLALSELVAALRERGILHTTVTAGNAFGGEHEAVNLYSALLVAKAAGADAVVAGIGPGVVGTGTAVGHSGLDVALIINATVALEGQAVVAARVSEADARARHQGLSHHTEQALRLALGEATVADPDDVEVPDMGRLLAQHQLVVTTMGRGPDDDPAFFTWAGAAGVVAARLVRGDSASGSRR